MEDVRQRTMQCASRELRSVEGLLKNTHAAIQRVMSHGLSHWLHCISQKGTQPTGKSCDRGSSEVMKTCNFSCHHSSLQPPRRGTATLGLFVSFFPFHCWGLRMSKRWTIPGPLSHGPGLCQEEESFKWMIRLKF